ncbi:MAG: helix-hairpin-helix domain-containing protein [Saprospiraceae bacterium]|nr:helix-hairpin-helix domain-containing protein [Saprospiraceae bacterium]
MKTHLFNYLRFNRAERNGTLALFFLAAVFFAVPEISRHFQPAKSTDFSPFQREIQSFRTAFDHGGIVDGGASGMLFNFDPNTASFEDFVRLGLSEKVSNIICNYRNKGGDFRSPADFQKIWSLKKEDFARLLPYIRIGSAAEKSYESTREQAAPELFAFDPNTVTEADLRRLGLPDRTTKSILNYRDKGGQFRKKEDLEKIYTLEEEDYARIAPYATFSENLVSVHADRPVVYAGGFATPTPKKNLAKGPVDINRAGLDAWMSLPGIGEMRARQLLSYREKLGGFISVEQVAEMQGLPDSVFQGMRSYLELGATEFRKINLNTASIADLDAHPYISKRQAELIVAFREQHGAFSSAEDLGRMRAFSDRVWLAKVGPYLAVE